MPMFFLVFGLGHQEILSSGLVKHIIHVMSTKSAPNGKTNHKNEVDQAVYTAYNILGYSV